ncbi:Acetolactate synthase, mitochondrial [Fusarium torreyae]|uniref:Acetolactate synthase, mitochondrial n=1 Tax=Fusarium torreyae TaxID=1237075 RepID=A0A9W8RV81_9HYPO|nr:Acetolactate synthase, mitochondrial [Fusarium torreyae]
MSHMLATADGYARASDKPGVVLVTSGPGHQRHHTSKRPTLSISLVLAPSGTSWSSRRYPTVSRSFRECHQWPSRTVLVDFPKDVTAGVLRRAIPTETALPSLPSAASCAAMDVSRKQLKSTLKRVGDLVKKIKKPIIYSRQGIILSEGGYEILKELAEKSSIPITTILQGLGAYDKLFITLGTQFEDRIILSIAKFAPGAKATVAEGRDDIVHFDIPKNSNKVVQATEAIEGNIVTNLKELLSFVDSNSMEHRKEWFAAIGVKVARPDALVINIDGDASLNMTLTELSTATQFNIGVKVIILNREEQNRKVSKPDDDALKCLINADGHALLGVITNKKFPFLPMVPVGPGLHAFLVFDEVKDNKGLKDKKRRELMQGRTCGLHG